MTKETDYFMREPKDSPLHQFISKHGTTMEMLCGYKPKRTEELAEWLMIASRNVVDEEGRLVIVPIKLFAAYQIARMMQIAKLKVPKDD
jgi:hypothetical protein